MRAARWIFTCGLIAVLCGSTSGLANAGERAMFYIGTYTDGPKQGIYFSELDMVTALMRQPDLVAEAVNPAFLAIHPNGKVLYAVNEVSDHQGKKSGAVSAFAIGGNTGKLAFLNQQPSGGAGPCHLTVDKTGKVVLVANYGGGTVASLPIDPIGQLSPPVSVIQHAGEVALKQRQGGPHAHSINIDPANKFALACDLGLDQVLVYKVDAQKGELTPHATPFAKTTAGAGPRHLAFHPNGKYVYVNNEISLSVTAFAYDADAGTLKELQTIPTLSPEEAAKPGNSTAEVVVHPSGKFVYVSNRGHDSIALFVVDEATGKLTAGKRFPSGGKTPRNFAIDPRGKFLLTENQNSGTIVCWRIDAETGELSPTGQSVTVPRPVCIKFLRIYEY